MKYSQFTGRKVGLQSFLDMQKFHLALRIDVSQLQYIFIKIRLVTKNSSQTDWTLLPCFAESVFSTEGEAYWKAPFKTY